MLRYFSPLLFLLSTLIAYAQPTYFKVRVENVGQAFPLSQSGVFNTPVDSAGPGPLFPGASYEFDFDAAPGSYLSFATMFVQSNDLFYGPDEAGIALYDMMGMPVSGDLTAQLDLWDAGTEENESPGEGPNQAPRQSGGNTGPADMDSTVRLVNDGFTYPADEDVIQFTLTHNGGTSFTARITNVSTDTTLMLAGGGNAPVPLAPGVFVVHTDPEPLFTLGQKDRGEGLEGIAEDGNASMSGASAASQTGVTAVLAPGVFVVHGTDDPLFTVGMDDFGNGLEGIAEDGTPGMQARVLRNAPNMTGGAFAVPAGAMNPGPLFPGGAYEFVIASGSTGKLSFATMFVQSNDLFYGPDGMGIDLFDASGMPISGDITDQIDLWDAGTELNEIPGIGLNQAPRQSGPNTGAADTSTVVRLVNDGYTYPADEDVIQVTIMPLEAVNFTVRIENVSDASTLFINDTTSAPVPLAPGVWAVHSTPDPMFAVGEADYGFGLEGIAEDGNAADLDTWFAAKMGTPSGLFNTPVDSAGPGPLFPGASYEFNITAAPGMYLSLATMFVQSNDLFYAPDGNGIPLFDLNGAPISGDVTPMFDLWDAGTEENEQPGVGMNQAPRQSGPDTGPLDTDSLVRLITDAFVYPDDEEVIRVTITPEPQTSIDPLRPDNTSLVNLLSFPNPFQEQVNIRLQLDERLTVSLDIFSLNGQKVAELQSAERLLPGEHTFQWDGTDLRGNQVVPGLYMVRVNGGKAGVSSELLLKN